MSFVYSIDPLQALLPGFYSLDVTATAPGYTSLTRTFVIEVDDVPGDANVRTLADLLTNIWRDQQGPKQLTAQDVRDTIVSLALQTGNFSSLPTQASDAASGRAYV